MSIAIRCTAAVLLLASVASADIIYLKSGRQISCDKAWMEGKQVKYTVAEGIVGIPRSLVSKIVKAPSQNAGEKSPPQTAPSATVPQSQPSEVLTPEARLKQAVANTTMGNSLIEKKDLVGALDYFKKAYDLVKTKDTTFNLALVYYILKDDWNASLLFHELLRLDPKNTAAMNHLAEMAWQKENLDEALYYWEQSWAITKDPDVGRRLEKLKKEKKATAGYDGSNTRHFVMKYDGGTADPALVDQISDYLEDTYQELSSQFEEYPAQPFVVVLYPEKEYVNITEAPYWSGGVNDGKIQLPIRGLNSLNDDLRGVLMHELTHSFINVKSSGRCPTWLQEGLAQRMQGKTLSGDALKGLRAMAEQNSLPSMRQLSGSFLEANSAQAGMLYVISLSFTEFLIDRYRFDSVNALLEKLGTAESFDTAFYEAFSAPISEAEGKWRRALQQ